MDILYGPGQYSSPENVHTAVALGCFDGVHAGHRKLIAGTAERANADGLVPCVYTFINHPARVISPDRAPKLLTTNRTKAEYISAAGARKLCFDWFDRAVCETEPEDFVKNILVGRLNVKLAAAGENYSFGRGGKGGAETLEKLGRKYGFATYIMPPCRMDAGGAEQTVSSSLLRKCVGEGDFGTYSRLAKADYMLEGTVAEGRRVGRKLGFPTANLRPCSACALPPRGVYATVCRISGEDAVYRGITNVGNNPTFHDTDGSVSVETHLLGFAGDVYGKELRVGFIRKMRDEIVFSDPSGLSRQIGEDAAARAAMPV